MHTARPFHQFSPLPSTDAIARIGALGRSTLVAFSALCMLPVLTRADPVPHRITFEASPTSGVVGYAVHVGLSPGQYDQNVDIGRPTSADETISYEAELDRSVDLYVAVSSYDELGLASEPSNELHLAALPEPAPEPAPVPEPEPAPEPAPAPEPEPAPEPAPAPEPEPQPEPEPRPVGARLGLAADAAGRILDMTAQGGFASLTMHSDAARGDLRPAWCDLDSDGDRDLVLGFGAESSGALALVFFEDDAVVRSEALVVRAAFEGGGDGQTRPACGDVDGDGRVELVVGMGRATGMVLQVFDDSTTGFATFDVGSEGRITVPSTKRLRRKRATLVPALGDIDGDGRDELVVGFEARGAEVVAILDDASAGFAVHPEVTSKSRLVYVAKGQKLAVPSAGTHPALGDWDGDGLDEIAVGVGGPGDGRVTILEDVYTALQRRVVFQRFVRAGRTDERAIEGPVRPAFGDLDGDGVDELVVGFGWAGGPELQILGDAASMPDGADGLADPRFVSSPDPALGWVAAP